jgi:hypothetical protein
VSWRPDEASHYPHVKARGVPRETEGDQRGRSVAGECQRKAIVTVAIDCDDGDHAAKLIRGALGIQSDEVANYVFPKTWPANREQRARIIGEWLKTEARFLVSPSVVPE